MTSFSTFFFSLPTSQIVARLLLSLAVVVTLLIPQHSAAAQPFTFSVTFDKQIIPIDEPYNVIFTWDNTASAQDFATPAALSVNLPPNNAGHVFGTSGTTSNTCGWQLLVNTPNYLFFLLSSNVVAAGTSCSGINAQSQLTHAHKGGVIKQIVD